MQLRVLSGLHRGAVLDLDEDVGSLTIGQSPLADAPMADAGLAGQHCRLQLSGRQWTLEAQEGPVLDARGQPLQTPVVVERGACFQLGDVWVAFQAEEDPWMEAPVSQPPGKGGKSGKSGKGARAGEAVKEAAKAQAASSGTSAGASSSRTQGRAPAAAAYPRMRASLASGVLAVVMLPFAAWFVSSAWGRAEQGAPGAASAGAPARAGLVASAPLQAALSPADLAEEFTHGLAERELVDKLDLALKPDRWEIRGSLDAEEQRRFERLLMRFTEQRKPAFPIDVALVTPAELLPFKVVEIISGKSAAIVTDSGARLSVGDSVEGYKLATIEPGKAVFNGKRRIEVVL